ncbi:MAG: UDP-N-acetylmuramoyl-tripeptide--D-alanyl-D-alanine ligase [Candidatus Omnitrophica bacterium]|nr:UDP-N-acetylmuramoyl-tripeptide--D-alanyl-D-alanine ligase [Candidatus Omnitrophota bacterium]
MEKIQISDIIKWTKGRPLNIPSDFTISSIITDSKNPCEDSLFIALKGERFDGHDFVMDVMKKKCRAVIVKKPVEKKIPQIIVDDTLKALGHLGKNYRKKFSCPVLGITGSDGKTTTKELIASFLSSKYNVVYNTGNLNNEIGLPLSLFKMNRSTDIGIFELGMNGTGQLRYLANILQPDVSVITSIGSSHIGFFKNHAELVCAKCELLQKTKKLSVINGDTGYNNIIENFTDNVVFFGLSQNNGFRGRYLDFDEKGFNLMILPWKEIFHVPFWNGAFAYSVIASLFTGDYFLSERDSMRKTLSNFHPLEGRGKISQHNGIKIFDESYNANPDSMKKALFYFSKQNGKRKIAVLGDMAELGRFSKFYHINVGKFLKGLPMDKIFTVGQDAELINKYADKDGRHFDTREELEKFLLSGIKRGDTILVKGSHINQLDKTVHILLRR